MSYFNYSNHLNGIQKFELDLSGGQSLFAVTDVHGHLDLLIWGLRELGFKFPDFNEKQNGDYLIVAGDMVDRGSQSYETIQAIRFLDGALPVRGNHEELAYSGVVSGRSSLYSHWLLNGGDAWHEKHHKGVLVDALSWAVNLPEVLDLRISDGSRIGVTHAGLPRGTNWNEILEVVEGTAKEGVNPLVKRKMYQDLCWSRDDFLNEAGHSIEGVDAVLHGHNSIKCGKPLILGNRVYFDTGVCYCVNGSEESCLTILHYKKGGEILGLFDPYRVGLDWRGKPTLL
ncbi:TPA: hypothetical protein I7730_00725 [Vibrio vulnificus]|uniref:Calcineurin-like phosphoesterase domain-containing protein n=1 Tax=Vibrio vulnificus TaxID=672 RepID=A0A8H9K6F9_VIBVL|nr:metallophosphoesterase [Vibrio vulnificus]HAS8538323.1 hypothetical protein [Vibrio vulnificus]